MHAGLDKSRIDRPREVFYDRLRESTDKPRGLTPRRLTNTTSYFVLGSYGKDERPRLEAVRDHLATEATASDTDDDVDAFLMDEILDITEFFTSKFKLLISYADHIIGVYEHSHGGHAWEAGYIDQPSYRERTRAFYRTYESDEDQYEAYDGMFAHYLLSMERVDRAHT